MRKINEYIRYAIYITIIAIFTHVDQLGFINLGFVSITTLPLIVIPFIMAENSWKATIFISLGWGINTWLKPVINPSSMISHWFTNPLIGMMPRVLAGIISFAIIRKIFIVTKKLNTDNTEFWAYVIASSTIVSFSFIGWKIGETQSESLQVIWLTLFGIIGGFISWFMFRALRNDRLSGQNFIAGLLGGATIAFVHTLLVLSSIRLFVTDESDLVYSVIDYSIKTTAPIELLFTAFVTMAIYPNVSNIKWRKPNKK